MSEHDRLLLPTESQILFPGKQFFQNSAFLFEKQDDYQVFNLKVKYAWKKYTAFLNLNNLFNEKYSTHGTITTIALIEPAIYPDPEFNLFSGLRFNYYNPGPLWIGSSKVEVEAQRMKMGKIKSIRIMVVDRISSPYLTGLEGHA